MAYAIKDHDFIIDNEDKKYTLKVKDLPDNEKPREKIIKYGPASLSAAELLAILLNVGTKKEEVLAMSNRLISEYGDKNIANETDVKKLEKELDIPIVKACQIVACFELGRRFYKKDPSGPIYIKTAKQAFEYLKDMRNLPKEHLRGLYLNSHYKLIKDEVISVGSLTANIVHPREVFKPALDCSAAAVIIAHNHPSGSIKPTLSDIETTEQIKKAADVLGIDFLDHLIIAKNKFSRVPFTN